MKKLMIALLAVITFSVAFAPQEAAAQHRRRGNNGGEVFAGVAAGLLGAAIIGSVIAGSQQAHARPVYGYDDQNHAYHHQQTRRSYVVPDDEDEVVVPRCYIKRQPLYDEDGRIVTYQNRRVCR